MTISLFGTDDQLRELAPELEESIRRVLASGRFILGPEVAAFEEEFARYLGVSDVVGVGNGTDAITIALLALGVGPGDDVVVPSYTFYASAEAIPHTGARPVFCDVDPETFCVTADTVERALTPQTKVVIAVDLFGYPAPVAELREALAGRGIAVLEDAAQAAGGARDGVRTGAMGDVATFSFFPSKNLFCAGDGGAITTSREDVAERARWLRAHCTADKELFTGVGFNSRLDAVQAAVLRRTLERLDGWNDQRRALAAEYSAQGLERHMRLPQDPPGGRHVYHLYVGSADDPGGMTAQLEQHGIQTRSLYRTPVHRQPAMERWGAGAELPGTDRAARENIAVPMGPAYGSDVARAVLKALQG
jgi:dTDP-3-amino-3,4,6-trideoxy-alpha-D-glucose transaminase